MFKRILKLNSAKTHVATRVETPVATPVETLIVTPVATRVETLVAPPVAPPVETPVAPPVETPVATRVETRVAPPVAPNTNLKFWCELILYTIAVVTGILIHWNAMCMTVTGTMSFEEVLKVATLIWHTVIYNCGLALFTSRVLWYLYDKPVFRNCRITTPPIIEMLTRTPKQLEPHDFDAGFAFLKWIFIWGIIYCIFQYNTVYIKVTDIMDYESRYAIMGLNDRTYKINDICATIMSFIFVLVYEMYWIIRTNGLVVSPFRSIIYNLIDLICDCIYHIVCCLVRILM